MTKKITLLFFICILSALNINAEVYEGSCGSDVRYSLDTETGLLSITGTGAMTNYNPSYSTVPWDNKRSYIKTVKISDGVTSIGSSAFQYCYGLTSINIPNSVTSIGGSAFSSCSKLTSVTIPNSVTSIGENAFQYCSGLTSVTIGNSVTSIGNSAFYSCSKLTSVHITDIAAWCRISFYNAYSNPLYYAKHLFMDGKEITDLVIPNSVTSIGERAFSGCLGLTSVTIPNSVTSIGDFAFSGCSSVTSVTIPNSVTSIGMQAFNGCSGLTSVTIPNSVTSIGRQAFLYCSSLESVTIPKSVTSIGDYAFSGCSKLVDFYCHAEKVPSTESAFESVDISNSTLHVPEASIESYKATEPWSGFGTIVALEGDPGVEKCATPTISFANGKIVFGCETEGVEFVSEVTSSDIGKYVSGEIPVTSTYTVSVYATKSGYEDSDVATMEINVGGTTGKKGDVNEDGQVNGTDIQEVINIIVEGE